MKLRICRSTIGLCAALLCGNTATTALAQDAGFVYLPPEAIEYQTAPGSGLRQAVLAGNPAAAGLYIIRIEFPAGVTSPPHYHDQDRYITVISGTWGFGMGDSGRCEDTLPLPEGSFAVHPKGAVHFDGACGDAPVTVEIRGMGPVTTTGVALAN